MQTIAGMIRRAADVAGDHIIHCPDGDTTYEALEREIRQVAAGLQALGVGPGDRVGMWLPNLRAWLALFGACSMLGAIAVAMNTRFRQTEIEDILRRARPKVIAFIPQLARSDNVATLESVDPALTLELTAFIQCGGGSSVALPGRTVVQYEALTGGKGLQSGPGRAESGCAIFTTSGTTSLPKFVLHDQVRIVRHAGDVLRVLELETPGTMVMQTLPFCGVFGFVFLMATLRAGASSVVPIIFDAAACAGRIQRHAVTHIAGGDDMMSRLLAEGDRMTGGARIPFPTLRSCAYASFNSALAEFPEIAYRRGLPLVGPYGMSEVFSFYSLRRMNDPKAIRHEGGGFPVNASADIRCRDPDSGLLNEHDVPGALEVASPNLFVGYYGDERATAAAMTGDGYLRTGDLAMTHDDGSFTYIGRLGDVLRLGGFLVNPLEIETHLCAHATVADAQVVAVATERGNRPVAFVIATPGSMVDPAELVAYCKHALAGYKVPHRVIAIDAFPTTPSPNGPKIQKGVLRQMAQASLATAAAVRDVAD